MKTIPAILSALILMAACTTYSDPAASASPSPTKIAAPATLPPTATPTNITSPTNTPIPPTPLLPSPTAVPPSPTPLSPQIDSSTVPKLSIFSTFGQGETLRSLAFSPDETVLASAGGNTEDFNIRIWDVETGRLLQTLDQHTDIVWAIAFSPNGEMLASVSKDKTAKVWDWRTGKLLQSLDFPHDVTSVTFSPDGQNIAIGGVKEWPDAAIWIFDVPSWQPEMELAEYWNIPDILYTPDGKYIVGGGTSRSLRIWQAGDGAELFTLYHPRQVFSLAMSPDGSTFAAGSARSIWIRDTQTGKLIHKLDDLADWAQSLAYSPDGSLLIARTRVGVLHFYDTTTFQSILTINPADGGGVFAISPGGRLLATARRDGAIDLWRVEH